MRDRNVVVLVPSQLTTGPYTPLAVLQVLDSLDQSRNVFGPRFVVFREKVGP